jgi:hypothetical protein
MTPAEISANDETRSAVMRDLIAANKSSPRETQPAVPSLLVQFWDDHSKMPEDVRQCLETWATVEEFGVSRIIFDDQLATKYITGRMSKRHVRVFQRCNHPAMRADYFRLCFIYESGGLYVDADDAFQGRDLGCMFNGTQLKLQPLCFDLATSSMVNPLEAANAPGHERRIFYVNNNPLVAPARHPLLGRALERATGSLLEAAIDDRDVQSLTGPGNLTAALVEYALERKQSGLDLEVVLLKDWDTFALSQWPLSYRSDERNWRNWRDRANSAPLDEGREATK